MERALRTIARLMKMNLVEIAYRDVGILNYRDHYQSGEEHLLSVILPRVIAGSSPVFFDVGANIGTISQGLRRNFPHAGIWAFEPNPVTHAVLEEKLANFDVTCMRVGLGSRVEDGVLHCYSNDQQSGHATLYAETFELYAGYGIEGARALTSFAFPMVTLDSLCEELNIEAIDFLKIDVEGHELEVLRGGEKLLNRGKISAIQFEISDCNVSSRVFLKDFYEQLPQHSLFRLNTRSLIPLGHYAARNEIFQFQNILAVRCDLVENLADVLQS